MALRVSLSIMMLVLSSSIVVSVSFAQEKEVHVHLKDGSRLVGKLVSETTDSIHLQTRYGEQWLARNEIESVEPAINPAVTPEVPVNNNQAESKKVQITLKDKRVLSGTLLEETEESIRLQTESGTSYVLPRNQIVSIQGLTSQGQDIGMPSPPQRGEGTTSAHGYPTAGGSLLFDGQLVYTSVSPDKGDGLSALSYALNGYTFIVRGIGVGLTVGYTSLSIGELSVSSFFIGPRVLLALGSAKSTVFPYLHFAYLNHSVTGEFRGASRRDYEQFEGFLIRNPSDASSFKVGVGFLFKRFAHIGIPLEFSAEFRSLDGGAEHTLLSISVGLTGFVVDMF